MKKFKNLFLLIFLVPIALFSQVTSGSINGQVLDEKNQPVMGAIVKAIHTPSGSVYGNSTKSNGRFDIQGLRVGGPYRIEASSISVGKATLEDVYVKLGEPTTLKLTISQANQQIKEVVVRGKNSIINSERTGAVTNVNATQLGTLPTVSRNITDFTRLAPQSGASFSSGLNNANTFGGRDGRYNNLQVNGANLNNGFGLTSNLTPGGSGQPFSLDAIEELQIGISPFDIKQSGFTGANVNAVTRSGTNEFHGSAYGFYRSNGMVGDMVDNTNLDIQKNSNTILGARLGGPIIKNKLFFFGNFEYEKYVYPGITWVPNNSTASGNRSSVSSDSLKKFSDYLLSQYGYETGPYENYGNDFVNKNTKILGRIDWNINEKHKMYFSYSQLNSSEDNTLNATSTPAGARNVNNRIGAQSLSFQNSNYSFDHLVRTISAELNSNLNSIMNNQLIGSFSYINDTRSTPGSLFPFIDITRGTVTDNYMSAGSELYSYKNDLKNTNFIVTDNLTVNLNNNTLTVGASFENQLFENSFLPAGTMYYKYNSLSDFMANKAPTAFSVSYPLAAQNGNTYVKAAYSQLSAYVQNKQDVSKNLSLTYGIRFELPFYDNSLLVANPAVDKINFLDKNGGTLNLNSGSFPKQQLMVSPRVSFNWDAMGDKSLQVRGGTGIFTGRIPFVWLTNQAGGIGTLTTSTNITDAATLSKIKFYESLEELLANTPSIASKFPSTIGSAPSQIAVVDENFKMPQIWRTDIGIDKKLPWFGLVATAEFLFTKDIYNIYQYNANLPEAQKTLNNGSDNRPFWTSNKVNSAQSGAYVLSNTSQGYSTMFTIGLSKQARKGFYGSLHYTNTFAGDISSNPGSQPNSAWNSLPNISSPNTQMMSISQYTTPNRVVGSLSYRFEYAKKYATTVSFYYEGASPGRYSNVYAADINGDGVNADLIYIPNSGSEINFTSFTSGGKTFSVADQQAAWDAYVAQDDYLNTHKGQYAARYGAQYNWYNRIDFKILQDIGVNVGGKKNNIQISLDIMNLPNLINSAWGVQKQLTQGGLTNNQAILKPTLASGSNTPTFNMASYKDENGVTRLYSNTFTNVNSPFSTWNMQLGLRYTF